MFTVKKLFKVVLDANREFYMDLYSRMDRSDSMYFDLHA